MNVRKKISPMTLMNLREALVAIYWYKKDLRSFIEYSIKDKTIITTINWDNYKRTIVSELINRMEKRQDIYQDDLLALIEEVSAFSDFSHLQQCEDPADKIRKAKQAVNALRNHAAGHLKIKQEREKIEKKRKNHQLKLNKKNSFNNCLEKLKNEYMELLKETNPQKRGYSLETLLKELFILFDLDPKSSFKNIGEQIDGAFTFDGSDYLVEAKWKNTQVASKELDSLASKISSKLKTTLGLFVSINGYSAECLSLNRELWKSLILMDGQDIYYILDGKVDLKHLLFRKRRHAAETGEIFLKVTDI